MNCLQEAYYGCAVCPKAFKFPNHLARHVEESHSKKDLQNKSNNFLVPKISIKPEKLLEPRNLLEPEFIMKYEETDGFQGEAYEFEEIVYTENHGNFDSVKDCTKVKKLAMFSCNICGKKFNQQRNLKRHHLIHTGELPYQCRYCNRKIRHQSTFKRHERIHTGEKPYSCRYCQMNFKEKTQLDNHENIHFTKEENMNEKICSQNSKNLSILDIIRQQISDHPRKPEMPYNFQTHESQCKSEVNSEECLDLRKHIISEAENIEIVKKELSSDNVPEPFLPITNKHFVSPAMNPVTLQPLIPMQGMPLQGMPVQGIPMQGMPMTKSMQTFDVMPILAKLTPVDSYRNRRSLPLTSTYSKPMNSASMAGTPIQSMLPSMTTSSENMSLQSFDGKPRFSKLTLMDSHGNQKFGFTPMPTTLMPVPMTNSSSVMSMPLSPPSLMSTPFASMLPLTPLPLETLNTN